MLRLLLALALLVVAVPAQWLGPTNVFLRSGRADVFVAGGRAYVIVWSDRGIEAAPWLELCGSALFPGRMQVELRLVGLAANDPRPCARMTTSSPSALALNDSAGPYVPWTIQPDGWAWWGGQLPIGFRAGPYDINPVFVTYRGTSRAFTPCDPVGAPLLTALLYEVRPL